MQPIVIIGAGLAGWSTARELRKLDPTVPVTMVTADSGDFYAKPSLSNALAQRRTPGQLVTTAVEKMAATQSVDVVAATRVEAIDRAQRRIRTSRGDIAYHRLVLATGALPIRVPIAGDAADDVLTVNSLDQFAAFHARLTGESGAERPRQVLIMGAGLIGCEFANDLAASGHRVAVVDPSPLPVAALLPAAAAGQLRDALTTLGVQWHFGTAVVSVDHAADARGPALRVQLGSGETLSADVVLSAVGLRADTALAQAAGLACERGVVVDACLRTSDPHIHALGDAAQYAGGAWEQGDVSGGRTLPYVMPIMAAAKALAATLAGRRTEVAFPLMPVVIKTPALPIVVVAPAPGTTGEWHSAEPGIWQFTDASGQIRGCALAGTQTARRAEQLRMIAA